MRIEKENIDAIELLATDFGFRGEVEHGIQVDARFGTGTALAHQAGPHGVVQFREIVRLCGRFHS